MDKEIYTLPVKPHHFFTFVWFLQTIGIYIVGRWILAATGGGPLAIFFMAIYLAGWLGLLVLAVAAIEQELNLRALERFERNRKEQNEQP